MKVLVINPNYLDATSYYRAWGTFKDLQDRHGIEFSLYESTFVLQPPDKQGNRRLGASWPDFIKFDVVFFQRALGDASLQVLKYCKDMGLKIWYDLDDDLWNIPDSYTIKSSFPPSIMSTIEEHIKASDLVTCSTKGLAEVIKEKTGKEAQVIPNAWDLKRYPLQPHNEDGAVIWRGSNTHKGDLRTCRSEIEEIAKHTKLQFWGYDPVKERPLLQIKDYEFVKPLDVMQYFKKIMTDRPKAVLVPLTDNKFNQSKSNIAWLEITAAGGLCFSNFVGEFQEISYDLKDIESVLSSGAAKEIVNQHQKYLAENYSITKWNDLRASLLKGLI